MKRIFLALFLLTATFSVGFHQQASAQTATTPVTPSAFTSKVNLLDSHIAAGNMTAANTTWTEVHGMMLSVLSKSKTSIRSAATTADKTTHTSILENQQNIYWAVWNLKTNLAANRVPLKTKLDEFGATIY
ncbi:MAG: hypothetical protein K0Q79_3734 [Flavipsychrobacter sp.]|jgi:hypothetical protein|nr:hypothetical protein [Flavipsychrobacter sp.]